MPAHPHVLVTGGCGFIGSHLVEALLARGARVRVLDNLSSGFRANLDAVAQRVEIQIGDVTDPAALQQACKDVDGIFHLAALVSVADSVARPLDNHLINATGTLRVLLAAREAGVKRVMLASTAAIYGNEPTLPKTEDLPPAPASPYAVAKLMSEQYLRIFHRLYGMETVALRFFNVYGPRQDPRSPYSGVISRFVEAVESGTQPVIFGDGEQSRDFVYVGDVVQACVAALFDEAKGDGAVYNVGTAQQADLLSVLNALSALSGQTIEPRFEAPRAGDIRHSLSSIDAARAAFNYAPKFNLMEGLRKLLDSL